MTGSVVFLKEFIALYYWYIELFTRKILNIHAWITSCPDWFAPNSGLTGPKIYIYIYIYIVVSYFNKGQQTPLALSWVFAKRPGDWGSIPGLVIPKTQKMVLDATLLDTQHYKVRIKCKIEQSKEWCSALSYTSVRWLLKR